MIGTSQNPTGLLPGASYANQISGVLKEDKVGTYYLFVRINDQNSLIESSLSNNTASGNPGKLFVTVNNTRADLTSTGPISIPPIEVGGTNVNFSYEVVNTGELIAEGRNARNILNGNVLFLENHPSIICESFIQEVPVNFWEDQVFLSQDSIFNPTNSTRLNLIEVAPKLERPFTGTTCLDFKKVPNGLLKNEHLVVSSQIRLPVSAFGKHYLHVVLNERNPFEERSRANNLVSSFGFEVIFRPPPDLNLVSGNLGANEVSILKPLLV